MKIFILFILSVTLLFTNSYAQLPNTDIWLLDVKLENGVVMLNNPLNITNRPGYDNQPAFSSDGTYLLYTSIRDDHQSDIYKYNLKTKATSQFTKTSTSEYSPTFMPDGKNISVVMVEPDSIQRLWKFPIKGGEPSLIMKSRDSIGYHCWLDNDHVALNLITNPMKLIFAAVSSERFAIIKDSVGRSMHSTDSLFFYLHKGVIYSTDLNNIETKYITSEPFQGEDFCIYNKNTIIMGNGAKLYKHTISDNNLSQWDEIADLSGYSIHNISRIVMSADGKRIAVVD